MSDNASPRPILMWPYESAPAEYRTSAARPIDSSGGMAFLMVVPAEIDEPSYWTLRQFVFGSATDCVCTFLASGDAVFVGTLPPTPSVYERLGGAAGVDRLVTRWREQVLADSGLGDRLKRYDLAKHRRHIATFLCAALGGAQGYDGPNLRTVSSQVTLTGEDFDLILHHLTEALRELNADAATITAVMTTLAPLKPLLVGENEIAEQRPTRFAGFRPPNWGAKHPQNGH